MDIAFTILVWAGLVALTAYGLRLVALLEQQADPGEDLTSASPSAPAERERVLVGWARSTN